MSYLTSIIKSKGLTAVVTVLALTSSYQALAAELPGSGIKVQPIKSSIAEETFQTLLVTKGLEKLGYTVDNIKIAEYSISFSAIANGDATFLATAWQPLHDDFYANAGGDTKLYRQGTYANNSLQGYLIDKATADKYNISNVKQLQDPKIAKLFDETGNGKADLTGCTPGWGCHGIIEHHLTAYQLTDTVTHNQGSYPAMIANTIARFRSGKPVLYYAWTPYWLSSILRPGKEVIWLEVPFTSLPGKEKGNNTLLPNGKNYGFTINSQHIVANKDFADKNPAAATLFKLMQLPIEDINSQNLRMRDGENTPADVERHTQAWITANQATFDAWIKQALAAATD